MDGKGIRSERETVIVMNEDEDTATIWTASETMFRKLKRLGYLLSEDRERSATFEVPKKLVSFRKERIVTDSQKQAMRDRVKTVFGVKTPDNSREKRG